MLIRIKSKKSIASNWLIFCFVILLGIGAAISEFFQAPLKHKQDLANYTALFTRDEINTMTSFLLKTPLGEFELSHENFDQTNDRTWMLKAPRELVASSHMVSKITGALEKITIKKIIRKDPINMANFSLNSPHITLDIQKKDNPEISSLLVGLSNSIDNTTYVTIEGQDSIYQVTGFSMPIEDYTLSQFIDSRVFSTMTDNLTKLAVHRGTDKGSTSLSITKKDNIWADSKGKELNQDLANELIRKLNDQNSHLILDIMNDKQKKRVERYLSKPAYTVITENDGKTTTYILSDLIPKISGFKYEKWQYFLIQSSARKYPRLIKKNILPIVRTRTSKLRNLSVKKLFY